MEVRGRASEELQAAGAAAWPTGARATSALASAEVPPPAVAVATRAAAKMCHGGHCFRGTFLVMAVACCVAAVLSGLLTWMTYDVYFGDKRGKQEGEEEEREESEQEEEHERRCNEGEGMIA